MRTEYIKPPQNDKKTEIVTFNNKSAKPAVKTDKTKSEKKEQVTPEKKKKKEFNALELFMQNKSLIYTCIFYSFGLFLGSYFYKISSSDTLNNLLKPQNESTLVLFISYFCVYFIFFAVTVFLGFCLIGYPIINLIPVLIGIITGIEAAYLFINYSTKGVGYAIIMVLPYTSLFMTVTAFTAALSTKLSKQLGNIAKSSESNKSLIIKPYISKYLLLALCVAITALIQAMLTNLLYSVVTI